ncbi:MAG: T9SS type A sorting domain-containing protein [Candidatus Kapaibacteriota bacterium]
MRNFLSLLLLFSAFGAHSKTIEVCSSCQYVNLVSAARVAQPGDTILIRAGVYTNSNFIENLQGKADRWITITSAPNEEVVFRGQTEAIHLSDPSYVEISNLIFEGQTGNGVNIDDGGTYETPAKFIRIVNCQWRSMNATGNNDMLKLSGVDDFYVANCTFQNGSAGGSGIDMVGCHNGVIEKCRFINQGSNSIQTKGGSRNITIQKNLFVNGGQRSLNIGGSTGLEFFRPLNVDYEASEIFVYSNIFVGSLAPIAFVGAVDCRVVNNTLFLPTKWAIRILQETTLERFQKCARNHFVNNIVYIGNNAANPTINIGPNTAPETFVFSNNLWYNRDNTNWTGPNLPVAETNSYVNIDPLIATDPENGITIAKKSPAIGKGIFVENPREDYFGQLFNNPRSVGAIEINPPANLIENETNKLRVFLYPNPTSDYLTIYCLDCNKPKLVTVFNSVGEIISKSEIECNSNMVDFDVRDYQEGLYFVKIGSLWLIFLVAR